MAAGLVPRNNRSTARYYVAAGAGRANYRASMPAAGPAAGPLYFQSNK